MEAEIGDESALTREQSGTYKKILELIEGRSENLVEKIGDLPALFLT